MIGYEELLPIVSEEIRKLVEDEILEANLDYLDDLSESMIETDRRLEILLRGIPHARSKMFLNHEGELEMRIAALLVYRALQLQAERGGIELPPFDSRAIGILNSEAQGAWKAGQEAYSKYLWKHVEEMASYNPEIFLMLKDSVVPLSIELPIQSSSFEHGLRVYRAMEFSADPILLEQRYNPLK